MRDELTPHSDDLDALLDSALATYADPEPSTHLEARILASTTRARPRQALMPRRAPIWIFRTPWRSLRVHSENRLLWATPALAALALAIFLVHRTQAPHTTSPVAARPHPPTSSQSPAVASAEAPPASLHPSLRRATIHAAAPKTPPLPRLEVFPTPTPLSREEQALAALVNRNPGQVAQSTSQSQQQSIELLRIAAIHIPPLNPPDNGSTN